MTFSNLYDSAPPPENNPGSAPDYLNVLIDIEEVAFTFRLHLIKHIMFLLTARQMLTENFLDEKPNVGGYGCLIALSGLIMSFISMYYLLLLPTLPVLYIVKSHCTPYSL